MISRALPALPIQNYITSAGVEAAPGHIVSETEHASTYEGATATTFEGNTYVQQLIYLDDRLKRGPAKSLALLYIGKGWCTRRLLINLLLLRQNVCTTKCVFPTGKKLPPRLFHISHFVTFLTNASNHVEVCKPIVDIAHNCASLTGELRLCLLHAEMYWTLSAKGMFLVLQRSQAHMSRPRYFSQDSWHHTSLMSTKTMTHV